MKNLSADKTNKSAEGKKSPPEKKKSYHQAERRFSASWLEFTLFCHVIVITTHEGADNGRAPVGVGSNRGATGGWLQWWKWWWRWRRWCFIRCFAEPACGTEQTHEGRMVGNKASDGLTVGGCLKKGRVNVCDFYYVLRRMWKDLFIHTVASISARVLCAPAWSPRPCW